MPCEYLISFYEIKRNNNDSNNFDLLGCVVINVSHLEVNNSANINGIILCFSGLIQNRITFHLIKEMAWSTEEKTFCVTLYLEMKSLKTVQVRYCRRFNFNNFPLKFQITCWVKKFKDTGTLIKFTKKGQKSTSGRKLTARSQRMLTQ